MEVQNENMEVEEKIAEDLSFSREKTHTRLFLPAPLYLLLSPPYIFKIPKMSLYNISDYVIRKSFFKFVISFRII